MLSLTTGFSYILVFIAGATIFVHLQARTVVVSISSAIPLAIFPITLAVAGAIKTTSASFASEICFTSNSKSRSKVSTRHLLEVSVSNTIGLMNFVAFSVIITRTLKPDFTRALATSAILYAAIPPVIPKRTVFLSFIT